MKELEKIVNYLAEEYYMLPADFERLLTELHKVSVSAWESGYKAGYQASKADGTETFIQCADGLREEALIYGYEKGLKIAPQNAGAAKGRKVKELAFEYGQSLLEETPDMSQTQLATLLHAKSEEKERPFGKAISESSATRYARALKERSKK